MVIYRLHFGLRKECHDCNGDCETMHENDQLGEKTCSLDMYLLMSTIHWILLHKFCRCPGRWCHCSLVRFRTGHLCTASFDAQTNLQRQRYQMYYSCQINPFTGLFVGYVSHFENFSLVTLKLYLKKRHLLRTLFMQGWGRLIWSVNHAQLWIALDNALRYRWSIDLFTCCILSTKKLICYIWLQEIYEYW